MNRLAITKTTIKEKEFISYIALDSNRDFVDFQLFSTENSILGNIYIAKVEKIVSNIQAIFLKISENQKCFLPYSEIKDAIFTKRQSLNKPVCEGDELLIQIVKEAVKTKEAVGTTHLTLNSKYYLLTTSNLALSVSKKIQETERLLHKKILEEICSNHIEKQYGIVTRTNAKNASKEDLVRDLEELVTFYLNMIETCIHKAAYTIVYKSLPEYVKRLQAERNYSSYDGIYTDSLEIYETLTQMLPYLKEQNLLQFYEDSKISLATLYHLKGNLDRLLAKQIWLKSGANIIIEQLETLTFIDVNTAKTVSSNKKTKDEVILAVNKEAAKEIASQIRLRNISGMILVDFINMDRKEMEEDLISFLEKELKEDVITCQFVDMTKLGLAEITRKKVGKSLKEIVDVQ